MNDSVRIAQAAVLEVRKQLVLRGEPSATCEPDVDGIDLLLRRKTVQIKVAASANSRRGRPTVKLRNRSRTRGHLGPLSAADVYVFVSKDLSEFWIATTAEVHTYLTMRTHGNAKLDGFSVSMQREWKDRWHLVVEAAA